MKKLLTICLAVLMVLSLSACGSKVDPNAKSEDAMTRDEFMAAASDTEVVIEGYVQAAQSYWGGATMYLADGDGGYFAYQMDGMEPNISEEDYAKLGLTTSAGSGWTGIANGTHVRVTGAKTIYNDEHEVWATALVPSKVTIIDDQKWIAEAKDLTSEFDSDLKAHNNDKVVFKGLEVVASLNAKGEELPFLYNWDGSGAAGDNKDVYFTVSNGTTSYSFLVESYLCYEGSDVYTAATSLNIGDKVDLEGFLYYYGGLPQLHTYKITVAK